MTPRRNMHRSLPKGIRFTPRALRIIELARKRYPYLDSRSAVIHFALEWVADKEGWTDQLPNDGPTIDD